MSIPTFFAPLRALGFTCGAAAVFFLGTSIARAQDIAEPDEPPAVMVRPPAGEIRAEYIEYLRGGLPIILTCGHDGNRYPKSVPSREKGVKARDVGTKDLTDSIAVALRERTGKLPYVIMSHLGRPKMDPNRDQEEATGGGDVATKAWKAYHGSIDEAAAQAVKTFGFAFIIDVHAHGHSQRRLELGYGISADELNLSDSQLNAAPPGPEFTLNDLLAARGAPSLATLIRGPGSIGDLYAKKGLRAIPSPDEPSPGKAAYFTGGYTIRHHAGGKQYPKVDGLQIETNRKGVRDSVESKLRFGEITVEVLAEFLKARYDYNLLPAGKK
jgi:N-formylglutamate amidohydrolase